MNTLRLVLFGAMILIMAGIHPAVAQFHHDSRTLGMGGIGVTTATGTAAVRHNPANLMLFERPQRWNLVIGQIGYAFSDGKRLENFEDFPRFLRPIDLNMPRSNYPYNSSRQDLLANRFGAAERTHLSVQHIDAMLFGLTYTGQNIGVAFTHFLRGDNSFRIGRGWYSDSPVRVDNLLITDRSFDQRYNLRHEFGLAMASEYDLISGWLSDLSKIYIGIHARIILPLAYSNTSLTSIYAGSEGADVHTHTGTFSTLTAGNLSETYASAGLNRNNPANLFDISGFGGGFDFGVTYILGFGGDVSLTSRNRVPTRNSLRIAASVTDIGFISYSRNLRQATNPSRNTIINSARVSPPDSQGEYSGNPADLFRFVTSDMESDLIHTAPIESASTFRILLPARVNAGAAIQLNRLIIGAEIQHPLQSLTDQLENTSFHVGGELRIIRTLPLRAGMQLEKSRPVRYHAGTGLDFRSLTFNVAAVVQATGTNEAMLPVITSVAGLHLRF
ncbi:MAG: DUF5723 family protein [Balneolales bacterium]|nr:DUF5723 family protein [Balneolales bacterium]